MPYHYDKEGHASMQHSRRFSPRESYVVDSLIEKPMTYREIQEVTGIDIDSLRHLIKKLKDKGVVDSEQTMVNGYSAKLIRLKYIPEQDELAPGYSIRNPNHNSLEVMFEFKREYHNVMKLIVALAKTEIYQPYKPVLETTRNLLARVWQLSYRKSIDDPRANEKPDNMECRAALGRVIKRTDELSKKLKWIYNEEKLWDNTTVTYRRIYDNSESEPELAAFAKVVFDKYYHGEGI